MNGATFYEAIGWGKDVNRQELIIEMLEVVRATTITYPPGEPKTDRERGEVVMGALVDAGYRKSPHTAMPETGDYLKAGGKTVQLLHAEVHNGRMLCKFPRARVSGGEPPTHWIVEGDVVRWQRRHWRVIGVQDANIRGDRRSTLLLEELE